MCKMEATNYNEIVALAAATAVVIQQTMSEPRYLIINKPGLIQQHNFCKRFRDYFHEIGITTTIKDDDKKQNKKEGAEQQHQ